MEAFHLRIADLLFNIQTSDSRIIPDRDGNVRYYNTTAEREPDYFIVYNIIKDVQYSNFRLVFTGNLETNDILNYKWHVYQGNDEFLIVVYYEDHPQIKVASAKLSSQSKRINVDIIINEGIQERIVLDPFIHPLGSLFLLYIMHWKKGLLIHASGIEWNGIGLVFTGVSGIGKSTMARLWKHNGGKVLNDDRLIIKMNEDNPIVYNCPMPYYAETPGAVPLKKIFLLKQSKENYIKPLRGIEAYSRVLANFIQQFYNSEMVKKHLEIFEEVFERIKVYEIGFKPDSEIVQQIKTMVQLND